jgi:16S rRNA (cytosine1402-N4)-methyltransferase
MGQASSHEPVLLTEAVQLIAPYPGLVVVDGTLGLAGHAAPALERLGAAGRLIGLDRDPEAMALARTRLGEACRALGPDAPAVELRQADFREMGPVLDDLAPAGIDGCLLDLGVSSMQLDRAERGFSFRFEAPLDMRMDSSTGHSAADLLRDLPEAELARIVWEYGEERYSRRIARQVVDRRKSAPVRTTFELADLVRSCYPPAERHGRIHPATRTFQALRIAVNDELAALEPGILAAATRLRPHGRIVVIAYHSLEDRIVKRTLDRLSGRCACPPELPVCVCGAGPVVRLLGRKPMTPQPQEIQRNPRARSARLRAAERLPVEAHPC